MTRFREWLGWLRFLLMLRLIAAMDDALRDEAARAEADR
jgi:hypothetical protein